MESRMIRRTAVSRLRATVGAVGGLLLLGVGGAAFADEAQQDGVDLDVIIEDQGPAGTLSLGVAADSETLTEVEGASPEYREFVGELPEVTVTDTRTDVPEGVYWYVTGQASDFVGADGQDPITPDHLGWSPSLVTDGGGEVAPGEEVPTRALDSGEASAASGEWTATADLTLKTPLDVEPGSYSSTLTLSLFEEEY